MMKGKTSSGFQFEVDDKVLDDWELIEDLSESSKNGYAEIRAAKRLLSEKQYAALKEHVRDKETGRVSGRGMDKEIGEIVMAVANNKKN